MSKAILRKKADIKEPVKGPVVKPLAPGEKAKPGTGFKERPNAGAPRDERKPRAPNGGGKSYSPQAPRVGNAGISVRPVGSITGPAKITAVSEVKINLSVQTHVSGEVPSGVHPGIRHPGGIQANAGSAVITPLAAKAPHPFRAGLPPRDRSRDDRGNRGDSARGNSGRSSYDRGFRGDRNANAPRGGGFGGRDSFSRGERTYSARPQTGGYGTRTVIKPLDKPLVNKVAKDPAPIKNRKLSADTFRLFAICPGGLDDILKKEIEALPANILQTYPGGVEFEGDLDMAYTSILKLRTASRVLLLLKDFKKIFKPEELYVAIQAINWTTVFEATSTFAVYLTESQSTAEERRIRVNPQFWALKAKDAIVDQFTEKRGERPSVDRAEPDITIRLHLHDQMLKVYLDLSGPSLHERGYRSETLEAPMKENLAAGLLLLAGWDKACLAKTAFLDPYCGSGTLLIEAALIATRTAPGLFRNRFGFMSWIGHDADIFEKVHARLKTEQITDTSLLPEMSGSDQNVEAVAITKENLRRAGMANFVNLKTERFEDVTPPSDQGLIVTNPPYGVRLDEVEALKLTYQNMGSKFKHQFKGWTVGVITSEKTLLHAIALKPSKKFALHNGGLESQYSIFELY
jgi:23S rRNA G2445 N2-methylase RlmL